MQFKNLKWQFLELENIFQRFFMTDLPKKKCLPRNHTTNDSRDMVEGTVLLGHPVCNKDATASFV